MQSRIENITARKLVGLRQAMTHGTDQTAELWRAFMPRRKEIPNRIGSEFYSVKRFVPNGMSSLFAPDTRYERWAAVEVRDFSQVPAGMETCILSGGRYAVFRHKGLPSEFFQTFQYIFGRWLPSTGNVLDKRDHFEVLSQSYRPDDPDAEEDIWIPIK